MSGEFPWRSSGSDGKYGDALLCKPTKVLSCHTFHILWRWRILHFHKPTLLLFGDEGYQVGRIQFIRCNRFVLEFIYWFTLFYGVWCWIVTHGSKTQIEAKIKPRSQLWEKNATVRRSWCQKSWAKCTKYFLRSPQMVLLIPHPTFFNIQTFLCVKNLLPFVLTTETLLCWMFCSPRNIPGIKANTFYGW